MARDFVRLKLRLLRNALRSNWQRRLGLVLGTLFAVPLAAIGFVLLAVVRGDEDDGRLVAVLVFSGLGFAWATMPLLGFGTDETLDPARLALFPLRRTELLRGLAAASLVGVAPMATAVALLGALVGFATTPAAVVIVPLALVVELAFCIVASRAVVTALSGLLRSRRGRDATVMAAAGFAVLLQASRFLFPDSGASPRPMLEDAARWLRWTPPGLAARSMADAAAGDGLAALGSIALATGAVAALGFWWSHTLERAMTSPGSSAAAVSRGSALFSGPLAALPRTALGACVARELRYLQRDPRRRVLLLSALVLAIGVVTPFLFQGGDDRPVATLAATALALMAGQLSLNQLALDGPPYSLNVAAGIDTRTVLLAKNLAVLLVLAPPTLLCTVVLAAVTGGWGYVPLTLALATIGAVIQLGVGNVVSVRAPQPLPDNPGNPWATNSGAGCAAGAVVLGALVLELVLLVPVVIVTVVGLRTGAPVMVVGVFGAAAYGAFLWEAGRRRAARWVEPRQPELLEAIAPSRA